MKVKTFYTEPKIVRFVQPLEDGELDTIVGLAVGDRIMCTCCGGLFNTCDIIKLAESGFDIQYEEFDWFDFSDYLI